MRLNSNFVLDRYGLQVRLVCEEDAEFIVKLRTDPDLGKYLNDTQNDIEQQKQWIRDYKLREEYGSDYYFIYSLNGNKIGLSRIYNIKDKTAISGSWICLPNLPLEYPILTAIIVREIFFEILELDIDLFDTRKENKKVIKMHNLFGAHMIYENDISVFHYLTAEDFKISKPKLLKYMNINSD